MTASFWFWAASILYLLFNIWIGWRIYNRIHRESGTNQLLDFWIASRKFPGWRLAVSLASGWLMLGWLGYGMSMIYMMGLSGLWILPLPWFILCIIIIWMVPFVRRLPAISLPEALQKRFGGNTRTVMALCSIFVFTSWTGAEAWMCGHLAAPFLGISPNAVILIVIATIMTYTYFGGFRSNVLTDVFQFFLCAPFILLLAIVSYNAATAQTGGHILDALSKVATPNYGEGAMFQLLACGIAMPIILLIAYLPGWMIEQDLLIRIQGANSLKEAKKGAWIGLVLIWTFVIILPTIIAFNAIVLFPPGVEASSAAIGADATGIISAIILKYLPIWVQVLMLVGILAAQMSTIDTFANVTALPMIYDLIHPVFLKKMSRAAIAGASRVLSVLAITLALIYALNANSLMDVYTLSSGVLTASIAIPAFAIFWKKANRLGILLAAIFGFLGNVVFYVLEYKVWNHTYAPAWLANTYLGYIIVGILASLAGLAIGILVGKASSAEELRSVSPAPLEGVAVFDLARGE
ncbi:MAG: sodium:solute symporter family protein [bacterium]|nr:sodium:solute symporter family protein [bacterium]